MAIWRKDKGESTPKRAVLASAMPLVGPDVRRVSQLRKRQTVEAWQQDAWYYYDAIGELRAPVNWISNAVSQANPFAAETDPETGLVTDATENETVQRVASMVLGGAAKRSQAQYILAVCWQVPGEAFIVIRPVAAVQGVQQPDEWLVLAGDRVEMVGGAWQYIDPATLMPVRLGASDRLIRVWSPHPRDQIMADTAVRPALPILREIEKSSMNIAARLDSRLAGNGILAIPQEINFPVGEGQSQATAVTAYLMEAMEASLSNPGTAGAQVPIVIEMPSELIASFKDGHLDLSTDFDASIVTLRQDGLDRLAATLDMPREVAKGTQGESNHWSAWQVEESTYKIYIEPLLQRIGDALTEYWFRPALRAMGVQNPERYVIDWDTSEIVARPDSTEDQNYLYEQLLISDDARRAASGVPDDAIPSEEELQLRRLERIVTGAPTLAADPQIARALFGFEIAPAAAGVSQQEITADPGSGTAPEGDAGDRALPATQDAAQQEDVALAAAASFVSLNALSRAGKRLLTNQNRGQFKSTPPQDLYLSIDYDAAEVPKMLDGSFDNLDGLAETFGYDPRAFETLLRGYVENRLTHKQPHDAATLRRFLR